MQQSKCCALPLGDGPMADTAGWVVGLEPTASRATIWRASQLRHTHRVLEGIRTPDPRLRRPLLYPAELQVRNIQVRMQKQVMGIEPTCPAWKAGVLPLNYTCTKNLMLFSKHRDVFYHAVFTVSIPFLGQNCINLVFIGTR